jgi:hypothetical protein
MSRFSTIGLPSIENDSYGWHLPLATAKDWKVFEQLLRLTAEGLLRFLNEKFPHIECIWAVPEKPSFYGYFAAYASQDKAFDAVKDSIRGFIIYTAYLSFLMGLFQCQQRDWVNYTTPTLLQNAQISPRPAWTSELLESGIGNFNNIGRRRYGCIINIPQCRWHNLIPS